MNGTTKKPIVYNPNDRTSTNREMYECNKYESLECSKPRCYWLY